MSDEGLMAVAEKIGAVGVFAVCAYMYMNGCHDPIVVIVGIIACICAL